MNLKFKEYLTHPLARGVDLNSPDSIPIHRNIIHSKRILRHIYDAWYQSLLPSIEATKHLALPMIELGCGASTIETYLPQMIKTDVIQQCNADRVIDAENLPFEDSSLRIIFMIDVFHHLKNPAIFLKEAQRCLAKGGRLVLIEPSYSPVNRIITKLCHPSEIFDPKIEGWTNNQVTGRLTGANMALPWIVFERDRKKFEKEFPKLRILKIKRDFFIISYFLSGGLTYRCLIPDFFLPCVKLLRFFTTPLRPWLCSMMKIEVEKAS